MKLWPRRRPKPLSGPVTPEAVAWAIRLFAGREPADAAEIAFHQQHASLEALRTAFAQTQEFRAFYGAIAAGGAMRYGAPPFLLRPPANPAIPWRFAQPSLAEPTSQLCTAAQFDEPVFAEIVAALHLHPGRHRKLWEHVFILTVMDRFGMIAPGRRALGFGCGRERIPALLAAKGVEVLATDAPGGALFNQGWNRTAQYAAEADDLFAPQILDRPDFDRLVSFRPVDMNRIPRDLDGRFDSCWSACSLEHLGSLRHGLDFIENSLRTLRPGGVAVHTTEFNLSSDEETLETPGVSVYRRRDVEELVARLVAAGHEVLPLNLHPGHEALDAVVDVPPYGMPHLKLRLGELTVTSIGIVVRRGAG